jgi:hypothetical protein
MREPQEHGEPVHTRRAAWSWQTDEPTGIGSGWVSGLLGAICGVLGLGAVLCFHYPWLLTTPEARALYPVPLVRGLLHLSHTSTAVCLTGLMLLQWCCATGVCRDINSSNKIPDSAQHHQQQHASLHCAAYRLSYI